MSSESTDSTEPCDILGNPVSVGDKVVFGLGGTMTLSYAKVVKVTKKVVILDRKCNSYSWSKGIQRAFTDVVVVERRLD